MKRTILSLKKINFLRGFTLVELLVVMSIIAILGAVMFGPFQTARARARDTQSVGDMRTLQNYLALYADDHSGEYPPCLDKLSLYGSLPSRSNLAGGATCPSTPTQKLGLYNYTTYFETTGGRIIGYHLYTHLNDFNNALRTGAYCFGAGPAATNCSPGVATTGGTADFNAISVGTDVANGVININYCKDLNKCVLDYHQ